MVDSVSRVACVWVEAFAAAAVERTEPGLRETSLAVVSGTAPARRVTDANAAARCSMRATDCHRGWKTRPPASCSSISSDSRPGAASSRRGDSP